MDESIKNSFFQEVSDEIKNRINKCENLKEELEHKLPEYFMYSDMQKIYMILSLIASMAFAGGSITMCSKYWDDFLFYIFGDLLYFMPPIAASVVFGVFSLYFFVSFLLFKKRVRHIKEAKLCKLDINGLKNDLNNISASLDKVGEIIEESFKLGKQFPKYNKRDIEKTITLYSNKVEKICCKKASSIAILNSILSMISSICFSVVCVLAFEYNNLVGAGAEIYVIAVIDAVLLIAVAIFSHIIFGRLNTLSLLAGAICPFLAFALLLVAAIALFLAVIVTLIIIFVVTIIGVISGG